MDAEKERVYFVIDMKTFFASVECAERALDPFKTNLVVSDKSRGSGALCLAITPKMKQMGIRNRCRMFEIPHNVDYIIAKPRMKKYIEYASEIYAIYLKYIDKNDIHIYSIDEAFIDATDYLKLYNLTAKEFAQKLMNELNEKLHIPSTVGIGTNMFLAKIALDITAKHSPDFIGFLDEEKYAETLWKHAPITDFWQISYGTEKRLAKNNLYTMEDIAKADEKLLYKEFGINAELLIDHAWGRETCTIADIKSYKRKSTSMSSSQILHKDYSFYDAMLVMREMIQNGCYELQRHHLVTQLVHLFVNYAGEKGKSVKGSKRMTATTNVYSIIVLCAEKIFEKIVDKQEKVRKIGFSFADLHDETYEQYDLFTDLKKIKKEKKLTSSVLHIKDKFGKNAILKGIDLQENATQIARNNKIGGHNSE